MKPKGEMILALFALSIFVCWAFMFGLTAAINAPTFHLDGAFQNASSLFRLNAGHFPGKDFFPYLGIGPVFIQFPVFYVLGADLAASVTSSIFTTLFCGMLVFSTLVHFTLRPSRFRLTLFIGCLSFLFILNLVRLTNSSFLQWFHFLENPGASLRPVRSIAPYLIALVYYLFVFNTKRKMIYLLSTSLLLGLSTTWSNDFALPTIFIFSIYFYFISVKRYKDYLRSGLFLFIFSFIFASMALIISTFGHVIPLLKFNFIDVAGDQWWYFAPYTNTYRIFDWKDVLKVINEENYRPLLILSFLLIYWKFNNAVENTLVILIGLVLFTGGALASIGGHLGGYFMAFDVWAVLVMLAFTIKILYLAIGFFVGACRIRINQWLLPVASVSALCISIYFLGSIYDNYKIQLNKARNDTGRFYVPELGAYLPVEWQDYIQLARKNSSLKVIEEYWGIWSAVNKVFPPWPVDSVIHALGNARIKAKNDLTDDKLIITTRYSTSPTWQPWNVSENFWFYEKLLEGWQPVMTSPTTVVWAPGSHFKFGTSRKCHLNNESRAIELPEAEVGFYRVSLDYQLKATSRSLLLIQNNYSYPFDANGFVSINPKQVSVHFPAYINNIKSNKLAVNILTNSDYSFQVSACEYSTISPPDANILMAPNIQYYEHCSALRNCY